MLLSGMVLDHQLWWIMVVTGAAAAVVSVGDSYMSYRGLVTMTSRQRLLLQVVSYLLLTMSIVAFISRGLISAS